MSRPPLSCCQRGSQFQPLLTEIHSPGLTTRKTIKKGHQFVVQAQEIQNPSLQIVEEARARPDEFSWPMVISGQ